jgi:HEPN domain-containing protein
MSSRAKDWLNQATRDLEQAADSQRAQRHEWACFAAQQAAEKAIKALHLHLGQEAWGHVVARLLQDLPAGLMVPVDLVEKGRVLDNFYIPSRYPNSHPEGAPFEHYGPLQSAEALRYAGEIVEFVRSQMA